MRKEDPNVSGSGDGECNEAGTVYRELSQHQALLDTNYSRLSLQNNPLEVTSIFYYICFKPIRHDENLTFLSLTTTLMHFL